MTPTSSTLALVFSILTDVTDAEYALLDCQMCIVSASSNLRHMLQIPDQTHTLAELNPTLFDAKALASEGYVERLWMVGVGAEAQLLCVRLIALGNANPHEAALLIVHPNYETENELAASLVALSDIYDSLHQTLFAARIVAESAAHLVLNNPHEAYQDMAALTDLLARAMREVRLGLVELHPHEKFEKPLHHLLDDLITTLSTREKITTDLRVITQTAERPNLPYHIHVRLYRTIQVLLQTVTKQADCYMIHMTVIYDTSGVTIRVDISAYDIPHLGIQETLAAQLAEIDGTLAYREKSDGVSIQVAWEDTDGYDYD